MSRLTTLFGPLVRLQDELHRFYDLTAPEFTGYLESYPPVNVWEEADQLIIESELPGLRLEDIELLATGNELTIRGERKLPEDEKEIVWRRREREIGYFGRTISLPCEVDPAKVNATLNDGVLTVRLPKSESAKPRKVKVVTS